MRLEGVERIEMEAVLVGHDGGGVIARAGSHTRDVGLGDKKVTAEQVAPDERRRRMKAESALYDPSSRLSCSAARTISLPVRPRWNSWANRSLHPIHLEERFFQVCRHFGLTTLQHIGVLMGIGCKAEEHDVGIATDDIARRMVTLTPFRVLPRRKTPADRRIRSRSRFHEDEWVADVPVRHMHGGLEWLAEDITLRHPLGLALGVATSENAELERERECRAAQIDVP